jgi:hypothetical protein
MFCFRPYPRRHHRPRSSCHVPRRAARVSYLLRDDDRLYRGAPGNLRRARPMHPVGDAIAIWPGLTDHMDRSQPPTRAQHRRVPLGRRRMRTAPRRDVGEGDPHECAIPSARLRRRVGVVRAAVAAPAASRPLDARGQSCSPPPLARSEVLDGFGKCLPERGAFTPRGKPRKSPAIQIDPGIFGHRLVGPPRGRRGPASAT